MRHSRPFKAAVTVYPPLGKDQQYEMQAIIVGMKMVKVDRQAETVVWIKLSKCRSLPNNQRDANRTINLNLLRTPSWLEIYANLQSPKTPKSISDKVPYRSVYKFVPISWDTLNWKKRYTHQVIFGTIRLTCLKLVKPVPFVE
ncbi:hypothetical protein TNCV_3866571 [Trichonephila clavipes]|nr:hypothetical protein TNCV_3866571 [Trichonephila clavipes]